MNEGTIFVLLILGPLTLVVLGRFLRNRQRLRLHEMAHRERMLALEKGLPVSEVPPGAEFDAWLEDAPAHRLLERGWDRRVTLGVGLVTLFASVGALLFAWLLPPTSITDAKEIKIAFAGAVIPLMASLGMLLYYRLTAPKKQ
jgi:hypothetical protein